ncbi:hypothetical protein GQ457_13G013200 [Hibiscus cannabinus]
MAPMKASRMDRYPTLFYQKYWHIVGNDVTCFCLSVLDGASDIEQLNNTQIFLIPKVSNPEDLTQFRPISLCNVLYKIVAKVLVNRLAEVLDVCIDKSEGAFIPGRNILDNIIIVYEVLHSMKVKHPSRCMQCNVFFFRLRLSKDSSSGIHWCIWDQLTQSKSDGGMGFCCLSQFNVVHVLLTFGVAYGVLGVLLRRATGGELGQYTLVSDLIEGVDRCWKYDVLAALFDEEQVALISSIPLSNDSLPDEIIWRYDGSGNYLVKSGYRLLRAEQARFASAALSSFFTEMWAVNVPVKVKVTMWRIANNFLPTFHNLKIRRLPVNNICPLCQSHGETMEHLTRDCEFLKSVTSRLALPAVSAPTSVRYSRNKLVHDGVRTSTDESTTFVEAFIQEQDAPKANPNVCVNMVVSFAKDLGFRRRMIEGDSLTIIKRINSDRPDRSPISSIVHDIRVLSGDFKRISFAFVRREANSAAHVLARECRSYPVPCYWLEEAPKATTNASKRSSAGSWLPAVLIQHSCARW